MAHVEALLTVAVNALISNEFLLSVYAMNTLVPRCINALGYLPSAGWEKFT